LNIAYPKRFALKLPFAPSETQSSRRAIFHAELITVVWVLTLTAMAEFGCEYVGSRICFLSKVGQ
jgi:hypothetical protein